MATILITGASSGIGLATAHLLAGKGHTVIGTCRSIDSRKKIVDEAARLYGERLSYIEMDLTDQDSVDRGCAQVLARGESLDAVVCNAGMAVFGSVEEVSIDLGKRIFELNFWGTLRTVRALVPHFREQGRGRVVIVGSLAGIVALPYSMHYSAGKFAVEALADSLRHEVGAFGIKVSLVRPGDMKSEMADKLLTCMPEGSPYCAELPVALKQMVDSVEYGPPASVAARQIERALTARRPSPRYTAAGNWQKIAPTLVRFLPRFVLDYIVRSSYQTK